MDASAQLQPHAWAEAQAIPTLGTKRPLSASGSFPRPLLIPLLLVPPSVFTRGEKKPVRLPVVRFHATADKTNWKNWDRVLTYFLNPVSKYNSHQHRHSTAAKNMDAEALPFPGRVFLDKCIHLSVPWLTNL